MDVELRGLTPDEWPEFYAVVERAFGLDAHPVDVEIERLVYEPERTLAAYDAERLVAGAALLSLRLSLPGNVADCAGVTLVGVLPTHRRRGLLSRLMDWHLATLHEEGGEALAALWASEANIYGRYGFGLSSQALTLTLSGDGGRMRPDAPAQPHSLQLAEPETVRPQLAAIFHAVCGERPGYYARYERWWSVRLADPEHSRNGWSRRLALVAYGEGAAAGYALYRTKGAWSDEGLPAGEAQVEEVVADSLPAYVALWRQLLQLDLVDTVRVRFVTLDDPLLHLLADPRRSRPRLMENLWLRVVDAPRALAARRYATPIDVVLELRDQRCPWNAGRWRLSADSDGAQCTRTADPADLALGAEELASAYLAGTSLAALAEAGRVSEQRRGALAAATPAFGWHRAPGCPMVF